MVSRRTSQGFVGRERELAAMSSALDAAVSGRGSIVLLGGEPGIGKTRTAEEVTAVATEQRILPLWGRCHEGEVAPAFWPWVQVLRAYIADHNPDTFRAALGVRAPLLARLIPEIDGGEPPVAAPPADPKQEMFLLFDGITAFLRAAAHPDPLLIVLDDLHWADAPSLGLLQYLAGELAGARILIVGAYRDTGLDRAHPLTTTLAELARVPGTSRLPLPGLADREVAQLLEDSLGAPASPALVSAVQQQTEGNAFFVTEVARLLAGQGERVLDTDPSAALLPIAIPPTVRDVIGRRLSRLSGPCVALLEVAAVFGREFPVAALQQVFIRVEAAPAPDQPIAHDRDRMLTLLEEAERAGIIADLPRNRGSYQFSHILIRGLLYEDLLSTRRSRLHRLVGEALEAVHAADLMPHYAELAHHFAMAVPAGDPAKAIAYARQAGDAGVRLYSYAEAAGHYRRALELLDLPHGVEPGSAPGRHPMNSVATSSSAWGKPSGWEARCPRPGRRLSKRARSLGVWARRNGWRGRRWALVPACSRRARSTRS
jgi:predicted ATPase